MRQRLINLVKFAVGIGLLLLLFSRLENPAQLWQQIVTANRPLLLTSVFCYSAAVALGGLKWGILLRAIGLPVALRRLLAYQWIAEFFGNFLPAQIGGDLMRGYALAADSHRTADAAASIIIDRFLGLLVFMLAATLASLVLLVRGGTAGEPTTGEAQLSLRLIALGSTAASLLLLFILSALLSRRLKYVAEWLLGRLPLSNRTIPIWQRLAHAFNAYRHQYRALLLAALGSLLIVLLTSVNIWLITQAITPGGIAWSEVLAINPMIVFIGLVLPLSPGGLGVRQSAFYATYLLVGRSGQLGLAVGLLQQLIGYLVSLPGGYLWLRSGAKSTPTAASLPLPDGPVG